MSTNDYEYAIKVITRHGSGSGFYVKSNDVFVTNHHVVDGSQTVALQDHDGKRVEAKVLLVCPKEDLAFLKVQEPVNVKHTSLWSGGEHPNIGESVSVLGFPFGMNFSVTSGVVSSINEKIAHTPYIQTDAAVNPGNSGGPVINDSGEIVGVTTSKFTHADNVGFALPIHYVTKELDKLAGADISKYSVKCHSCGHYMSEPEEYCDECGAETHADELFHEEQDTLLMSFVEEALKKNNLNPVLCREGYEYWQFHQGSALVRIFLFQNAFLYATAPLVELPSEDIKAFYEYLLHFEEKPFYIGLKGKTVFLNYRVHMADIDNEKFRNELQSHLADFLQKADDLDNILVDKYGCVPAKGSRLDEAS